MIIDAKTGKPGPSHAAQVLTYEDAVPKSLVEYCGVDFRGHVVYPDAHVGIPASGVDGRFIESLASFTRRLASETPTRKVPSSWECRWCDITKADCPDRIDEGPREAGITEDF